MNWPRLFLDRLRTSETILRVDLLGRPARFSIVARRELRRTKALRSEAELLTRLLEFLEPDDVAYDIGANIGVVSLLLALHRPAGSGQVHAFEPEPTNHDRLRRNIELNGLADRVVAHRLAVGADDGEAELFVRPGAGEGRHSIATWQGAKGSIRVPVSTMTAFARACGQAPDFLKIDVEGAEGLVLAGMEGLLPDHRPREIFLEIHPKGGGDRMPSGQPIHEWLGERGYARVWERKDGSQAQRHYR